MASMLTVTTIPVTAFEQNATVLLDEESRHVVLVDPGGEVDRILATVPPQGKVVGVWLTHSHLDHCGGVAEVLRRLPGTPLFAHPIEKPFREQVRSRAEMFGLSGGGFENCPEPTHPITGGEDLKVGKVVFSVRHLPGHSPGHVVFHAPSANLLIAGDTLMAGSIGRTDLPGSNPAVFLDNIDKVIMSLPDDTRLLPGHGPETTVGLERDSNPFLLR